jgi:hypothetical protein
MNYIQEDYQKAIEFALNYPSEVKKFHYNIHKDIYDVILFDAGWYNIKLNGEFVRSCLKWKGIKKW